MSVPDRDEYDSLNEWVTGVADATGVAEKTIWDIVEEIRPGASAVTKNKATLLRRLLEHHIVYMETLINEHGQPDLDCKIQLYVDDTPIYEFQYPGHNVVDLHDHKKAKLSEIIAEEGLTKQAEGERYLAALLPEGGLEEEVRIIIRILEEVHDISVDDVERAIEIRGQKQYSWTDEQELKENIQQISTGEFQLDQSSQKGPSTTEAISSGREKKDYDEWIFCQTCGEKIATPDENPRYCSDCRG